MCGAASWGKIYQDFLVEKKPWKKKSSAKHAKVLCAKTNTETGEKENVSYRKPHKQVNALHHKVVAQICATTICPAANAWPCLCGHGHLHGKARPRSPEPQHNALFSKSPFLTQ